MYGKKSVCIPSFIQLYSIKLIAITGQYEEFDENVASSMRDWDACEHDNNNSNNNKLIIISGNILWFS